LNSNRIMTLVEVLERNARDIPDKTAIVYHNSRLSYRDLNGTVNRLAHALTTHGLEPGDHIGLMLPRMPELIICFLAAAKARGIVVPINFELHEEQIRDVLKNLAPRFLFVHEQFLLLATRTLPAGKKTAIVCTGGSGAGEHYVWSDILGNRSSSNPAADVTENDVVYLNYTSGTTGKPKGAVTTHAHIFWNTHGAIDALQLTAEDIHLCLFAPFAHPHEIFARPLYLGGSMVLLDNIRPRAVAHAISEHSVTCFMGVAPLYETLLEIARSGRYGFTSLRIPESGGMFTKPDLIERFADRFGVPILPVWGSTETTGIAIATSPGGTHAPGSVGTPCRSYDVKIIDEDGKQAPPHMVGELAFKGPGVVSGYHEAEERDRRLFQNGWYYSGDLAKQDGAGNIYFVERKTGMMKVAGLAVYPLEVEKVLMNHPAVKEAAVIAMPDRMRGEVPRAFVVLHNGHKITDKEIMHFCNEHMARYKVPKMVEFRETLPRIGGGKINKKMLQVE